jgi:ribosomal protein L11
VSHKVKGKTATIKISVPSAGKLVATGKGVSKGTGKASKAGDVTVKVSLTKKEQAFLAKHKGRKLKVDVKLVFTPASGGQLTSTTTVLLG